MNLSNVSRFLFKVQTSNMVFIDAFGMHIGDCLPKSDISIKADTLYISAKNIKDAVVILHSHNINILVIEKVDILLEVN